MGCGHSKKLKISKTQTSKPKSKAKKPKKEIHVSVFEDSANNNQLGGSDYNAKPRLRSAIRRSNDFQAQPSFPGYLGNEQVAPIPTAYDLIEQDLPSDLHDNIDSGFDSNRANSEASDWARSSREGIVLNSGRVSHSSCVSVRPESTMTSSVVTTRDLNTSFVTTSDDFTAAGNGDMTFDTEVDFDDSPGADDPFNLRFITNTPSRSGISLGPTPINAYHKNIEAIKEESEGGFTPRSLIIQEEVSHTPRSLNTQEEVSHTPRSLNIQEEGSHTPRSLNIQENVESQTHISSSMQKDVLSPRSQNEEVKHPPNLPKFPSDEIVRQNKEAGWCERGIRRGLVFDTSKVIEVFSPMHDARVKAAVEQKQAEKLRKKQNRMNRRSSNNDSDNDSDFYFDSDSDDFGEVSTFEQLYPKRDLNPMSSLGWAVKILVDCGIEMSEVIQHLEPCVVGEVDYALSPKYWTSYRQDVEKVLDDLIRDDLKNDLTPNAKDTMGQFQRWIKKYRHQDPEPSRHQAGDPNKEEFLLPDGIQDHPECLREWVDLWEQFDLQVPENGAWFMYDLEDIDLGDPDALFCATLRSDADLIEPFDLSIDGEVAWIVIHQGLVADDVMTEEQRRTEESRRDRTDLDDPHRMERRRKKILKYFIQRYEMDKDKVKHFLQWAQSMEDGERRFQLLCST